MDERKRSAVIERAGSRCEYCWRHQQRSPLISFHIEHIIPRKHGGVDGLENLCLACPECNLRKGSDLTGFDPQTGLVTRLFHPREQDWDEHFNWDGRRIMGITPVGRATVAVLDLNSPARLRVRIAIR